jgi:hypothetical protein
LLARALRIGSAPPLDRDGATLGYRSPGAPNADTERRRFGCR